MSPHPRLTTILRRGWQRRCPRCGEGPLFERWLTVHERCSACRLLFQRNHGDTWMFLILTDRVPILFGIAAVYFGFRPDNWLSISAFFVAMAIPILGTLPQRTGLALGLDYFVRIYMPDPSDEIHGGREHFGVSQQSQ